MSDSLISRGSSPPIERKANEKILKPRLDAHIVFSPAESVRSLEGCRSRRGKNREKRRDGKNVQRPT